MIIRSKTLSFNNYFYVNKDFFLFPFFPTGNCCGIPGSCSVKHEKKLKKLVQNNVHEPNPQMFPVPVPIAL